MQSREEVFGPVIALYEFLDERETIRRANDTEFGLYATVWTNDLGRGYRVANEIEAGSVMVNQYSGSYPQTPFGGYIFTWVVGWLDRLVSRKSASATGLNKKYTLCI
ncbi:aldehyde dehydrogenase family protein [Haloterrigena turkmenica]|uniref:aldehyde dehydrogenase family protein n=1 Tax=Haloterrigena turkmenica TaxID=62320 RepID=UPI001CF7B751|nr:aldehyde dehydrogenase family protein [Haloterrigena turkmenica]